VATKKSDKFLERKGNKRVIKDDPRLIWVAAQTDSEENGSYINPYGSISRAVECSQPGQIVVLKAGNYIGDVTIQKGGTIDKPLRIVSEDGACVQCIASCWFFYDVSDIICSGIIFKDSPGLSLSVVGKCMRNRFEFLQFINCSIDRENACTFFLGGSGQACNTVESCRFERTPDAKLPGAAQQRASVGLMISEGDFQEGDPNRNTIISKCIFSRYDYGVIIGSQDSTSGEYGHQVVYNSFDNCASEAIIVKCGDTLVKGNVLRNCGRHSISITAGTGSIIEDNRIVDCGDGIRVAGRGHSISNNCIIRCREASLSVLSSTSPETASASNIIIERNTIVGWENAVEKRKCGVRIEPTTTCVVRQNLFHDTGKPYDTMRSEKTDGHGIASKPSSAHKHVLITDNIASGLCAPLDGWAPVNVMFRSAAFDNYMNDSGYGADGWMLSPEAYDPGPEIFYREGAAAVAEENEESEKEVLECPETSEDEADSDADDDAPISEKALFFDEDNDNSALLMLESEYPSDDADERER
jgi:hypothetical protein